MKEQVCEECGKALTKEEVDQRLETCESCDLALYGEFDFDD